jgi:hypothetical protein
MFRADEQQDNLAADREYGLAMLNRASEELREASSYEHRTNGYHPDETDLARDRAIEREFEQSEWDYDPTMRGQW